MRSTGRVETSISVCQGVLCEECGAEYIIETVAMLGFDSSTSLRQPMWCAFCGHHGAVKGEAAEQSCSDP
ncbi:MAG: hypothetical protein GEU71_18710 [Actinobacteria bacterium]|nr:hypothetical protein [Actinomycetota bacterium]